MPEQKTKNKNIRKLTKVSKNSFAVIIPVDYINKLKWKEHQKLLVGLRGSKITIEDWPKFN